MQRKEVAPQTEHTSEVWGRYGYGGSNYSGLVIAQNTTPASSSPPVIRISKRPQRKKGLA